jgi:outer membrane lipoprotein-sorting protein
MNTKRYGVTAFLIAATVVLSGCAASRSEIKVAAAAAPTTATVTKW